MKYRTRTQILLATTVAAVLVMLFLPRMPQPGEYHDFADGRSLAGIPNFLDVVSNAALLAVGVTALTALLTRKRRGGKPVFIEDHEKWPWIVVYTGVILTGIGSAYYHWNPHNASLFWDRLPMTLVAMGFLSAMLTERVSVKHGPRLLPFLALAGMLSAVYWIFTESRGAGDLRPYGLVQFLPILLTPLILLLFPPRYNRTGDIFTALGLYVLAKIFETFDRGIFGMGQIISGHALKHLAAAAALFILYRMIERRAPLISAQPVAHLRRKRGHP